MADAALPHDMPAAYEPSLFGTYSKKIGMWLFLMSDSLTFGALLYAYSYGRISTPSWPTPFHSASIVNATVMTAFLLTSSLTMVLAVRAAVHRDAKWQRLWLLATMACGIGFVVLHGKEWGKLISEGLTLPVFPKVPGQESSGEFFNVTKTAPQFPATFFGLTGMHMLHVTLGVVYLGVVALRRRHPAVAGILAGGLAGHAGVQPFPLRRARDITGRDCLLDRVVAEAESLRFIGRRSRRLVLALRRSRVDVHFPAGVSDVGENLGTFS
jgi:cytochrome c oxidase subunit III